MRRAYDEKYRFLSTPSARRATAWSFATRSPTIISIHALREEGDLRPFPSACTGHDFYPRPPRGGRPCGSGHLPRYHGISIHALREEGDLLPQKQLPALAGFLSTPSARRATREERLRANLSQISIHALREEGDEVCGADRRICEISIHALREEGDARIGHLRGGPA